MLLNKEIQNKKKNKEDSSRESGRVNTQIKFNTYRKKIYSIHK